MGKSLELLSQYTGLEIYPTESGEIPLPCPFHKGGMEHKPSFSFNCYKNVGYCHTCNKGWTIHTILKMLGASPNELKALPSHGTDVHVTEDEPDYGIDKFDPSILRVFAYFPKVLEEAGFDDKVVRDCEVGYDKYTRQITYPIRDHLGGLVGISGRSYERVGAKYLPYGEAVLGIPPYKKKFYMWGAHKVYPLAMLDKVDKIVVTEGFKAAMWCMQSGYHAVALMGRVLSKPQMSLLLTMGAPVVFFPDQDKYGLMSIETIGDMIGTRLPFKIVEYDGDEPDAVAIDEVPKVIEAAIPYASWLIEKRRRR